jgi:hypothetical protein
MSRLIRTGVPLVFGALVAGCVMAPTGGVGPDPGREAPAFEGVDGDGQPLRLSEYRGQVVLLHFWHSH